MVQSFALFDNPKFLTLLVIYECQYGPCHGLAPSRWSLLVNLWFRAKLGKVVFSLFNAKEQKSLLPTDPG